MEGIAGEAAHTRRLSTGRPPGAGEAMRSGSLMMGWTSAVAGSLTASVTSNAEVSMSPGSRSGSGLLLRSRIAPSVITEDPRASDVDAGCPCKVQAPEGVPEIMEGQSTVRVPRVARPSSAGPGAMGCKAPRQRWHVWQRRQRGFCKLQNLQEVIGSEPHPLRQYKLLQINELY
jgi:hypothetical protein